MTTKLYNVLNENYELLIPQFEFICPFNIEYNLFLLVNIIKINDNYKVIIFLFKENYGIILFTPKEIEFYLNIINNSERFIQELTFSGSLWMLTSKIKSILTNLLSTLKLKYGEYDINSENKYFYLITDLDIFIKYISGLRKKVKGNLKNFSIGNNVKRDVLNKIPDMILNLAEEFKTFISGENIKDFINSFEKSNGKIIPKAESFKLYKPILSKIYLKNILKKYFVDFEISTNVDFEISTNLPRNYIETPSVINKENENENEIEINNKIKQTKMKIKGLSRLNPNSQNIQRLQKYLKSLENKKQIKSSLKVEQPIELTKASNENENGNVFYNAISNFNGNGYSSTYNKLSSVSTTNFINENENVYYNLLNSQEVPIVINENNLRLKSNDDFLNNLNKNQKEALNKLKKNVEEYGYLIYAQLIRLYNEYNKKFEKEKKIFIGDQNNYMDLYKNFVRIMVLYLNEPDVKELYNNILLKRLELDTFYNLFTEIIINSSYRDGANGSNISFDIDIKNIDNNNKIWVSHIYMFGDYFDFKNNSEFINKLTFDNNPKYNYSIPIKFDVKNKLFLIQYIGLTFNLYHIFNYVCKEILESNGNYCLYSDNLTYIIEKLKLTNQIKLNEFYLLYKIIRSIFDFNSNFVDGKYQEGMRSFKNGIRPNFYFMGSIVPYGKLNILEEFILNIRHNTNGLDYYMYNLIQMTKATMYKSENLNHLIIFEDLIRRDFPLFRDLINLINNSITQNMIKKFSKNYSNEFNNKSKEKKNIRNEIKKLSDRISILRGDLGLKYNISLSESNNFFKLKIKNKLKKQKIFINKKIQEYLILIEKLKELKSKIGNNNIENLVLLKENRSFDLNKFIQLLNQIYTKISNKSLSNMQQLEDKQMFGQYFSNERLAFNKYFIFYNLLQDIENMPNFIDILLNTSGLINLYEVSPSLNLGNYPTLYTFNFDLLSPEIQIILNRINLTNKNMIIFDRIKQNKESIENYEIDIINKLFITKKRKSLNINKYDINLENILLIYKNIYELLKNNFTKLEICQFFYLFGVQSYNKKKLFNIKIFNKINSNLNIEKIKGLVNVMELSINNSLLNLNNLSIERFENKLNQRIKPLLNKLDELMTLKEQIVNQFTQGEKKFNKIQQNIQNYINRKYGKNISNNELEIKYRKQFIKDSKLKAFLEEKKILKEINQKRSNFDEQILSLNQEIQKQERKIKEFKESPAYQNYLSNIKRSTAENKVKKYIKKKKSDRLINLLNTIN